MSRENSFFEVIDTFAGKTGSKKPQYKPNGMTIFITVAIVT
jgi:hypothetical protein